MLEKLPDAVGAALKDHRAGLDAVLVHRAAAQGKAWKELRLKSTAFEHLQPIPVLYTADGEGISPPLYWSAVPSDASQILVVVEDADSPTPRPLVHAIALMQGVDGALGAGALPSTHHAGAAGLATGLNSYLQHRWLPPDPPPGHGVHRYIFQVFALGAQASLSAAAGRHDVEEAIKAHAIAAGLLIGTFERGARETRGQSLEEPVAEAARAGGSP